MSLKTIGILSPGEMGQVMGKVLKENGLRVVAALADRSARTRGLAADAGIEDVGGMADLMRESDMVLSVLVPSAAVETARAAAKAMEATGARPIYVDCNAISPDSTRQAGEVITAAGARFVDASIIGPPPRKRELTRFYASGTDAGEFARLSEYGLDVRVLGDEIGQASGIKMCYAGLTKGLAGLAAHLLIVAERQGLSEPLRAEFETSQKVLLDYLSRSMLTMPPKAHRWIGEMHEIAATYEQYGMTPKIFEGEADVFSYIARTRVGRETPEERDTSRDLWDVIRILAEQPPGE